MIAIGAASAAPAWSASAERLGDTLYYRASVGEANDLDVNGNEGTAPRVTFHDAGAVIRAGVGCAALADGGVECGSGLLEHDGPPRIEIRLRDGDDHANSEVANSQIAQRIDMYGGPGIDTLHSGSAFGNTHVLSGGGGNDHLSAATNNTGHATFVGGPGNDVLDNQEGGLAWFYGGAGNDDLRMSSWTGLPLVMDGGPGADLYAAGFDDPSNLVQAIRPGPGRDTLSGARGGPLTLDLETCGGCVENVIGSPSDDTILGDGTANVLLGGGGNDVLNPRGGLDRVAGQDGDDQIELRDGQRDAASCGDGLDQVSADENPADPVAADCEHVVHGGG